MYDHVSNRITSDGEYYEKQKQKKKKEKKRKGRMCAFYFDFLNADSGLHENK